MGPARFHCANLLLWSLLTLRPSYTCAHVVRAPTALSGNFGIVSAPAPYPLAARRCLPRRAQDRLRRRPRMYRRSLRSASIKLLETSAKVLLEKSSVRRRQITHSGERGDVIPLTSWRFKVAVHTVTNHRVAMKFISKAKIHALRMKMRVTREIEYLRMLNHPHIIKL
jgi:hypothetical protein